MHTILDEMWIAEEQWVVYMTMDLDTDRMNFERKERNRKRQHYWNIISGELLRICASYMIAIDAHS